jgi:hypothetical protein
MAANVRNVLVGAAQIFVSTGNGSNRPVTTPGAGDLAWTAGTKATNYLDNSSKWRDVGYTNTGFELSYEPGYGEVMVDQLLDAARLFKQTLKIMLKTELTEGTLENMNLVFGQMDSYLTYANASATTPGGFGQGAATGTTISTFTPATSTAADATGTATLNLAAGALGDYPVERSLVAVGNSPANIGTESAPVDAFGSKKERVYVARRVVQMQTTAHALKRDGATVFPVQFRCLPDDNDAYDGKEYGVIIDRVWTTA